MEKTKRVEVSMGVWLLNTDYGFPKFLKEWTTFYGSPSTAWWWGWYQEKGYRWINYAPSYSDTSGKANSG